jgi:aspartate-semialdehyde dehydrogenase
MLRVLGQRDFPVGEIRLLASERSVGKTLQFRGEDETVQLLQESSFEGVQIALFSAGGSISKQFVPAAVKAGAIAVDNTSAFRMEPGIPLVVPEVNPDAILGQRGIIANPNCSTIQMVVALKPLHDRSPIRRIVVSTYQATSGAGQKAMDELFQQTRDLMNGKSVGEPKAFQHRIAFNCIPHIDVFQENGYTKEEMKMVGETRKIMGDDSIAVTATAVRVPVFYGHAEAVTIETEEKIPPEEAREILASAPGVRVMDDPATNTYPMQMDAAGQDDTLVGRIREDISHPKGLCLWVVADNIRKGAATNAVQIAEYLVRQKIC